MNCQEIYEFLDETASSAARPMPPSVSEHCNVCERCRRLVELLKSKPPVERLTSEVESGLRRTLLESLKPVSPLPRTGRLMLGFLAVFALLSLVGILLMGTGAVRVMSLSQLAGVALVVLGGALLLSLALSWLMAPGSYRGVLPKAAIFGVAAALFFAMAVLFPWRMETSFLTDGFRCAMAGFLLAAPSGACLWLVIRRGVVLSPGLAGAAVGLLAGLVGALVLHFGCIVMLAPHLLVWHAGIAASSALAGFFLGKFSGRGRDSRKRHDFSP